MAAAPLKHDRDHTSNQFFAAIEKSGFVEEKYSPQTWINYSLNEIQHRKYHLGDSEETDEAMCTLVACCEPFHILAHSAEIKEELNEISVINSTFYNGQKKLKEVVGDTIMIHEPQHDEAHLTSNQIDRINDQPFAYCGR